MFSSRKGLLPVLNRQQALWLCLDTAVVVIVQIINQFPLKAVHRIKFLQTEQLAFEQAKEVFYAYIFAPLRMGFPFAYSSASSASLMRYSGATLYTASARLRTTCRRGNAPAFLHHSYVE